MEEKKLVSFWIFCFFYVPLLRWTGAHQLVLCGRLDSQNDSEPLVSLLLLLLP